MCKHIWLWTAVNRKTKRLVGFHVGDRSSKSFENLCENISHIDAKFYATDQYTAYDIIPDSKHLVGKSHTYTVERMNRLLRHYLARFTRKTYCWSKNINVIIHSVFLFLHRDFFHLFTFRNATFWILYFTFHSFFLSFLSFFCNAKK